MTKPSVARRGSPQGAEEPGPGERPVALHGSGCDPEDFGGFVHAEPREKAQAHDGRAAFVNVVQSIERAVERENLVEFVVDREVGGAEIRKRDLLLRATFDSAALLASAGASAVDEDTAHRFGGRGEVLRAVRPALRTLGGETKVRLVNEFGGTKRSAGALAPKPRAGERAQFRVNRVEHRGGRFIAAGVGGVGFHAKTIARGPAPRGRGSVGLLLEQFFHLRLQVRRFLAFAEGFLHVDRALKRGTLARFRERCIREQRLNAPHEE